MPKQCCIDTWTNKIKPDEPVFIIRGQDLLAPMVIAYWLRLAGESNVNIGKLDRVKEHLEDIERFQRENPVRCKMPD